MSQKIAHIISRQAGSAYPLVEFSQILTKNNYEVHNFTYEISRSVFKDNDLAFNEILNFQDYKKLNLPAPDLIFTGTSFAAGDDMKFWQFGQQNKSRVLAWLDQFVNFDIRFPKISEPMCNPDLVLTTNQNIMTKAKCHNNDLNFECCGSPYLQTLALNVKKLSHNNNQKIIIFASEPTPDDFKKMYGYDHFDALKAAVSFVNKYFPSEKLHLKLHPRDKAEDFLKQLQLKSIPTNQIEICNLDKHNSLASAHMVLGMTSMYLFESASIGIKTVSFQPNATKENNVISSLKNILTLGDDSEPQKIIDFLNTDIGKEIEVFDEKLFLDFASN